MSEQRQLFLRTGVISQAKGSAYVEQGTTKVSQGLVVQLVDVGTQMICSRVTEPEMTIFEWSRSRSLKVALTSVHIKKGEKVRNKFWVVLTKRGTGTYLNQQKLNKKDLKSCTV